MPNEPWIPWAYLGALLVGSLLVDLVVTRLLLSTLRPASAWVFWCGRLGKLTAMLAFVGAVLGWWLPTYFNPPESQLVLYRFGALGVLLVMALFAVTSIPRRPVLHRSAG